MAEKRRVQINLFRGESAHQTPAVGRITSRSEGWIPHPEGFLKTYKSGKRVLPGEDLTPGQPGNNGPIQWDDKYVRSGKFFTDTLGRRRLVTQVGRSLFSVDGNDVTELFKYPANVSFDDGLNHVYFIEHQNHIIFLHPDFPPLKWGGDEPVSWLGVREIPSNPEVHVCKPWGKYFESRQSWGIITTNYMPPVFVQHDDATEPHSRGFKYVVAYMNSRGQIGRWSESTYAEITPSSGISTSRQHPVIEWRRPKEQGPGWELPQYAGSGTGNGTDITHVVLARTNNTIADREAGLFMVLGVFPYTMNRTTDQTADAGLSLSIEIDNYPPVNASFGCEYKDTLIISGNKKDPYGVWYSKPGFMEAFPPTNYYKAQAPVTAVVPLSDRVCVITKSGIEVLRQTDTGAFGRFRIEARKGSQFGRSIVEYKGSLFGIFDGGFGIFDGFSYKGMADEYGELFDFISNSNADRIRAHVDTSGRYWVSLDWADYETTALPGEFAGTGLCLVYDFTLNGWFRVEEAVTCIFEEDGELYFGGRDNFRLADAGDMPAGYKELEIAPTFLSDENPQFALLHKRVQNLYLRISSTGNYTAYVDVYVDELLAEPAATGTIETRLCSPSMTDQSPDSTWGEAILDEDATWDAPRYGWVKVRLNEPVDFYSIRVMVRTPGYMEISGIAMDLHIEQTQETY